MKIIHLISGLRGGGAEHLLLELCKCSLTDPSIKMKVASLSHINDIGWKFQKAGIEIIFPTVRNAGKSGSEKGWSQAMRTIRQVIRQRPDTVHAHLYYAVFAAALIKLLRPKTRIIFTLHNNHQPGFLKRLALFLTKSFRNADVIFPGEPPAWYQKKNAVAIANGIDLSPYVHLQSEKPAVFTCLFLGRLTEQKNPLFLVHLAKSIGKEYSFMIRVSGEGPLNAELSAAIRSGQVEDRFELTGYSEHVPESLAQVHCLLLPSLWEGMPLAILEAGAAGIPILATPEGAIPSLLNDSNAYITRLEQFPDVLKSVMDNYGEALIRARCWREFVFQHFDIRKCYEKHLVLWSA